jgi:hypothetical protein
METTRTERLQQARSQFNQTNRRSHYTYTLRSAESSQENSRMPYFANYILRTILVLFALLGLYLYGVNDADKQNRVIEMIRSNVNNNSSLSEAYTTYSQVDYKEAYEQMLSYAKGLLK